jgi:hypothetical protein
MQKTLESEIFAVRLRNAISFAWSIFMKKAGNDLLPIINPAIKYPNYAA